MRSPMFGIALLAFLFLAVVLAVAVFFAFKSGEQGKTKLGGFAGCAIALALVVVAGIGALATVIVLAMAVHHGRLRGFEWRMSEDSSTPAPDEASSEAKDAPLHVSVELRGTEENRDVMRWIRKHTDERTTVSVHEEHDAAGEAFTVIEITPRLDVHDRRDIEELVHDLKRDLPDLHLPSGGRIEIKKSDE